MNSRTDIYTKRLAGTCGHRARRLAASPGSVHQCYSYGYDGLNRLVSAAYSAGSDGIMPMSTAEYVALNERDYSCTYGYDVNGNVTSLRRKGVASAVDDGGTNIYITYGDIDDLSLTYDGNRLSKVSDAADALTYAGAMDFRDGADVSVEYTYDANGNMTVDLNKGINLIRYNVLNLPGYVQFADGHSVTYTYDADGNKLRTVSGVSGVSVLPGVEGSPITPAALDDVGQIEGPVMSLTTRDYCGGHVYMDGRLERTLQPWGYTGADGADYFYINDYLGNVRTVTDRHGYACELNAYYPYGALMNTLSGNGTRQPYKYGGKELDRTAGLDLYDSQARFYDPVLGRTTTVDPKSAAYAGTSHYGWCAGNPVRFVDPDGERPTDLEGAIISEHIYEGLVGDRLKGNWELKQVITKNNSESFRAGIYSRTKEDGDVEYVIAYAGTFTDDRFASSAIQDLLQIYGKSSDLDYAIEVAQEFCASNSDSEITLVGHSKGGTEATGASLATGKDAITYNPAKINSSNISKNGEPNIVNNIVDGELISKISIKATVNDVPQNINYVGMINVLKPPKNLNMFQRHSIRTVINILRK